MRYFAKDLQSVYEILEALPKPLAVLDFFCGSVGGEFTGSQSIGGLFYDFWSQNAWVAVLCWEGASILYSNVSDDQIEFTDREISRLGDKIGKGWRKKRWLANQGHEDRVAAIAGIVAYSSPVDATAKGMRRYHELDTADRWKVFKERLTHTGYVFSTGDPPLVREPYIAVFDRQDRVGSLRQNVHAWQVELFHQWAQNFGYRLVVISDFYPRHWEGTIHVPFADRSLSRLCNVIHHSVLYAASAASGSGVAGLIFGCNFVGLRTAWWRDWAEITRDILPGVVEGRGFQFFGIMDSPDGEVANRVKGYLERNG